MDFDETRLYYSHQQLQVQSEANDEDQVDRHGIDEDEDRVDLDRVRRHFREFLSESCRSVAASFPGVSSDI